MKVRLLKKQIQALQSAYPEYRLFLALEAPSRQEVNDAQRRGYMYAGQQDGLYCYGKP